MIWKIAKIDKETLVGGSITLEKFEGGVLFISNQMDAPMSSSDTLSFTVTGVAKNIPKMKGVSFCTVVRKKVSLSNQGKNYVKAKERGKDTGQSDFIDSSPEKPLDLPPGFREVYKS